jgi:hypothetical protein
MKRLPPVHNLRPNEKTWTPAVVAFLDTETRFSMTGDSEVHTLRCWSARLDVRRDKRKVVEWQQQEEGMFASDSAFTLANWNHKHPTLWVYCHNLAFDLTTSEVTTHLAELGYTVTEFAIDSPSPFIKMSNGRCHITFTDSFSWLPARLEDVAKKVGIGKPPLPSDDDGDATWLERCRADVNILATAMLDIMRWWEENDLGHWSVTGSASGWNVMRHKIDAKRITINPSPQGIEADRRAIYGGRRGLWRAGKQPASTYADIDFSAAYPTIAESLPLPHERMSHFASLPVDHRWITSDRHGIIARVRIETPVPRWPVRIDGRVWYPVGEFWTDLAGPDIAEAARLGCLREIGAGYVHRLGYALQTWAQWCLATSRGDDDSVPEVVRLWAKHCGRAVIGKWAQRKFDTIEIGPSPRRGWWAQDGWNHSEGVRATIIDFDGRRWQASASGDGDNCYPAVLAYVEAYVRVRLARMIESMPAGAVLACDTDGLLADMVTLGAWQHNRGELHPLAPRVKAHYTSVDVMGPQHMTLDGNRRLAGIPGSAKPARDGKLSALLWPKMVWQMNNGRGGEYIRPVQEYKIAVTYAPGWVLDGGDVVPVETAVNADGKTVILPFDDYGYGMMGRGLAEYQNKDLKGYYHDKDKARN